MSPEYGSALARELEVVYNKETAEQIVPTIQGLVGSIQTAERVSGGYVHYVFRVGGEERVAYLKARGDHFARLPHIETDPKRIAEEHKALQLYIQHCAQYFPEVLHFDADRNYLLLTELLPGVLTLEQRFLHEQVSMNEVEQLGFSLGDIHAQTASVQEPIRPDGDQAFKENLFKYVIEYPQHPSLLAAATEHWNRNTQLLIGDTSPKNVFVNNTKVGYCDLEGSHQGSVVYDQAFMLAHLLLHQQSKLGALTALQHFVYGYAAGNPEGSLDFGDKLLPHTIQGIFLYRLDNDLIPYNLDMTRLDRKKAAARIYASLSKGTTDIEEIIDELIPE